MALRLFRANFVRCLALFSAENVNVRRCIRAESVMCYALWIWIYWLNFNFMTDDVLRAAMEHVNCEESNLSTVRL